MIIPSGSLIRMEAKGANASNDTVSLDVAFFRRVFGHKFFFEPHTKYKGSGLIMLAVSDRKEDYLIYVYETEEIAKSLYDWFKDKNPKGLFSAQASVFFGGIRKSEAIIALKWLGGGMVMWVLKLLPVES